MELEQILKSRKMSKKFKERFQEIARQFGETLIEPLPAEDIIKIIQIQGYYCLCAFRVYYKEATDEFLLEERRFG